MKYRALRIVGTVYRVIGWIVIVVGVLSSCGLAALSITAPGWFLGGPMGYGYVPGARMSTAGVIGAIITLVMGLIMTALSGITLLALAEGIQVFLDIEENTGEIARRIRELPGGTAPSPGAPE
jgi:vacuolar-type H+-ATPase subunit I/STV1